MRFRIWAKYSLQLCFLSRPFLCWSRDTPWPFWPGRIKIDTMLIGQNCTWICHFDDYDLAFSHRWILRNTTNELKTSQRRNPAIDECNYQVRFIRLLSFHRRLSAAHTAIFKYIKPLYSMWCSHSPLSHTIPVKFENQYEVQTSDWSLT